MLPLEFRVGPWWKRSATALWPSLAAKRPHSPAFDRHGLRRRCEAAPGWSPYWKSRRRALHWRPVGRSPRRCRATQSRA